MSFLFAFGFPLVSHFKAGVQTLPLEAAVTPVTSAAGRDMPFNLGDEAFEKVLSDKVNQRETKGKPKVNQKENQRETTGKPKETKGKPKGN